MKLEECNFLIKGLYCKQVATIIPLFQYEMVNIHSRNENFKIQKVKHHFVFFCYLLELSHQADTKSTKLKSPSWCQRL